MITETVYLLACQLVKCCNYRRASVPLITGLPGHASRLSVIHSTGWTTCSVSAGKQAVSVDKQLSLHSGTGLLVAILSHWMFSTSFSWSKQAVGPIHPYRNRFTYSYSCIHSHSWTVLFLASLAKQPGMKCRATFGTST